MLRVLVVGQFAISIFLATGSFTVYKQLAFMRSGELGFDKEYKYVISFRRNSQIKKQVKTLQAELMRHPHILETAASSSVPGRPLRDGHLSWSEDKIEKPSKPAFLSCDDGDDRDDQSCNTRPQPIENPFHY